MSNRAMNCLAAIGIALLMSVPALSAAPAGDQKDPDARRLAEAGPAVVKTFVARMRKPAGDQRSAELRKLIDPRYLKEHRLEHGPLPVEPVVTGAIYDLQVSDEPQTILTIAQTQNTAKEAFLFRTTVHEGNVYIRPLTPPDPATGTFKPWILRAPLQDSAGK